VMSYHFVLEAKSLVDQYLRSTGKEKYTRSRDNSKSSGKLFKFLWSIITKESDIVLSFGQPMDVFGHSVDIDGRSLDKHGNEIDITGYFKLDGKIKTVAQREKVYTKLLGEKIVDSYKENNVVLSSHLVAFAAFRILIASNTELNIYDVLNVHAANFEIEEGLLDKVIKKMLTLLKRLEQQGKVKLSETLSLSRHEVINDGIMNLGLYHPQKVLKKNKKDNYVSENFRLLYFYHNRLDSYGLQDAVNWDDLIKRNKPITEKSIL